VAEAVVDISEIHDPEGFKAIPASPATSPSGVAAQGGRYITRTDKITAFDGTAPKRFIVIAFDSEEKAKAWNNSASQNEVNAIRAKTTKSRSFIGCLRDSKSSPFPSCFRYSGAIDVQHNQQSCIAATRPAYPQHRQPRLIRFRTASPQPRFSVSRETQFCGQRQGAKMAASSIKALAGQERPAATKALELDEAGQRARKHAPLSLDLSGIAKGYGVDEMTRAMQAFAVPSWLVGIDGEMSAKGLKPDGLPWTVALERPQRGTRDAMGVIELTDLSPPPAVAAIGSTGAARSCRTQ
jgi:uncharacterized protein (DUF1330 family)